MPEILDNIRKKTGITKKAPAKNKKNKKNLTTDFPDAILIMTDNI
jgi:hypothetical protein